MCAVQLDNKTLFRKTNCQTDRNYIKSGLAQDVFLQKPSSASYLLTPDRRKTLVFSSKIQETCLQDGPPGASTCSRFATIPPPVIRYLINDFGKIVGYLTLSPQAHALVANLLSLIPTVIPRCPAQGRTSIKRGTRPLCLSTKATEDDHLIPTAHSQRD